MGRNEGQCRCRESRSALGKRQKQGKAKEKNNEGLLFSTSKFICKLEQRGQSTRKKKIMISWKSECFLSGCNLHPSGHVTKNVKSLSPKPAGLLLPRSGSRRAPGRARRGGLGPSYGPAFGQQLPPPAPPRSGPRLPPCRAWCSRRCCCCWRYRGYGAGGTATSPPGPR